MWSNSLQLKHYGLLPPSCPSTTPLCLSVPLNPGGKLPPCCACYLASTVSYASSALHGAFSTEGSARDSDCRLRSRIQFLHRLYRRAHPLMNDDHGPVCSKIFAPSRKPQPRLGYTCALYRGHKRLRGPRIAQAPTPRRLLSPRDFRRNRPGRGCLPSRPLPLFRPR
jgi:hypothetical protein